MAACLAMLTFTGCASGILGGGLFGSGCDSGCNISPSSMFGGGGLLSDGPIRQFLRGDACDSCNAAAGQVAPGFGAPTCDACGSAVPASDPYALPVGNNFGGVNNFGVDNFGGVNNFGGTISQPTTSFYPSDAGVSLGQPALQHSGIAPLDPGAIYGGGAGGTIGGLSEPPGIN